MEAGCDDHLYSSQTHELLRQHSNLSTYQNINRKIAFYHHLVCCTFSKYVGIWQKNKKTLQVHHLVTGNTKSTQDKFEKCYIFLSLLLNHLSDRSILIGSKCRGGSQSGRILNSSWPTFTLHQNLVM